jgi:hypothetical protein
MNGTTTSAAVASTSKNTGEGGGGDNCRKSSNASTTSTLVSKKPVAGCHDGCNYNLTTANAGIEVKLVDDKVVRIILIKINVFMYCI